MFKTGNRPPEYDDPIGVAQYCNNLASYVQSKTTDTTTAQGCKRELYLLKCLLEDLLAECPEFEQEKLWEQERMLEILKKKQ